MLRISQCREGEAVVVRAEGRLAGSWVDELRGVLQSLQTGPADVALELADVGYVDAGGEKLLKEAIATGVRILRRSSFVAALTGLRTPVLRMAGGDREVVDAILGGNEGAFVALVDRYHQSMIRVARCYLWSEAIAEEVVQDVWMAVLRGLEQWEGRASLRTWLFSIVAKQARARCRRESRTMPFSALGHSTDETEQRGLDLNLTEDDAGSLDYSAGQPDHWRTDHLESREVLDTIRVAIDALPPMQRAVITFRDVAGCDADEACTALHISAVNQRVLLHRARVKVRAAVQSYLSAPIE